MKKTKKVIYKVKCANNPKHIFDKVYKIEKGNENQENEMQAYCPFCDDFVTVTIRGKAVPDESILRKSQVKVITNYFFPESHKV